MPEDPMFASVRFLALFCLAAAPVFAQQDAKPEPPQPTAELTIPPDAVQKPNPVKPTPAVLAAAKKTYGYDCAMCHGADGSGKGDLAADMKLTLLDYRDPSALKNMTDGEMFWIIEKGKGQMTGEGDRIKAPEIWGLVNYVRAFAKKTPSASKAGL
jgi:mono/diheme cytochrome c family protein